MRKIVFSLIAAAAFALSGFAQEASAPYALPFVSITRDGAQAAMGGAGSSMGGAFSALRNPAAAALSGVTALEAGYQSWSPDNIPSTNINAGGSILLGSGLALELAFATQSGEAYDIMSDGGVTGDSFTPSDMLIGAGLGYMINEALSLGASFKIASQKLSPDDSYSAFALDLSALYRTGDVRVGGGVSNLLGSVKASSGDSFSLPASVFVAADWSKSLQGGSVSVALDADYFLKGGFAAALGAQYGIKDIAFLRAGYHLGSGDAPVGSYASVGAGLRFKGFGLDAAYLLGDEAIGGGLLASLSYRF